MSKNYNYENTTKTVQKVFIDGVTGPSKILQPGERCRVRLDADQKIRVVDIKPERKPRK